MTTIKVNCRRCGKSLQIEIDDTNPLIHDVRVDRFTRIANQTSALKLPPPGGVT